MLSGSEISVVITILIIALIIYYNYAMKNPGTASSTSATTKYENDISERCKDWIYYRNQTYKYAREGKLQEAEEARRAMNQYYNDMSKIFTESQIAVACGK